MRVLLSILILTLTVLRLHAQDSSKIVLSQKLPDKRTAIHEQLLNEQSADSVIDKQLMMFYEDGFLEAAVDSSSKVGDTLYVQYSKGPKYQFGKINLDKIPTVVLNGSGIAARDFNNRPLSPGTITRLANKLLTYAENNGFPFAKVYFENIKIDQQRQFTGDLVYSAGRAVFIDTVKINGSAAIDQQFLESYIGIRSGSRYDESQIKDISRKINNLVYLKEQRPWEMNFSVDKNTLNLYLEEKKSNQINALIGLQPTNQETQRFLWTADVVLGLNNALGYGESITASYKNLQPRSPQLNAAFLAPSLVGTNIGLDGSFEFFRRDTLFRRTVLETGSRYLFTPNDFLRVFYQSTNNRVQQPDTAFVRLNKMLPENADINARGAGMDFVMNRTDNVFNPIKGWSAILSLSGLDRRIIPDDAITNIDDGTGFDYNQLYKTANEQTLQYKVKTSISYFRPVFKNFVLKIAYNGGLVSGKSLFKNELFQIGGFKLLRGFEEQSIFANQYHLGIIEMRTLINPQSFLYLFSDGGYTQTSILGIEERDMPLSFGAGVTLQNNTGIFNVALALGKHSNSSFQFRNVQIHFGYVALF